MSSAADLSLLDEKKPPLPVIFGIAGDALSTDEKALFREIDPLGYILFARNCTAPEQIKKLVSSLQDNAGRAVPILIDQEGGRVQRLKPPQWTQQPAAQTLGDRFTSDFSKGRKALIDATSAIARDLTALGINVNCAPVLDIMFPETDPAIGDRAFSSKPEIVAALGALACETYAGAGIIPVVKHMPGQGRAASDSHKELPRVEAALDDLAEADFIPYRQLLGKAVSGAVWGMVAHVIYTALDPRLPASASRRVVWDIIRQIIGFKGFLLSDDVGMGALSVFGAPARRVDAVLRAGCDAALHCDGDLAAMKDIAARTQRMTEEGVRRYNLSISYFKGIT